MFDTILAADSAPAGTGSIPLVVCRPGQLTYGEALAEQRRIHAARVSDQVPDTLLVLEHPHVYTLGRNSDPCHVLVSDAFLRHMGASIEHNERGGEVTYHGPGQLVAYPIMKLRPHERSLTGLVDGIEDTILLTLARFGIAGRREPGERGVWVRERKIASIGLSVRRWVVMHGLALNVAPDLRYFGYINPCGHPQLAMTSMALELGSAPVPEEVAAVLVQSFCTVFGRRIRDE